MVHLQIHPIAGNLIQATEGSHQLALGLSPATFHLNQKSHMTSTTGISRRRPHGGGNTVNQALNTG